MCDTSSAASKTRMTYIATPFRGGSMTARRRGRTSAALWALATLSALLLPAPTPARAAGPLTLQVTREVNSALGGDAPTLTAHISGGTGPATIDFEVLGGPNDVDGDALPP